MILILLSVDFSRLGGRRGSVNFTTRPQGSGYTSHTQIPQRCDAKRPCTTCVKSGSESGCFYEELRTPSHVIRSLQSLNTASEFPVSDGLDAPGPSSGGSFPQLLFEAADVVGPPGGLAPQIGRLTRFSPGSPVLDTARRDLIKLPSASHLLQRPRANHPHQTTNSRLHVLPSLRLSIIPRSFNAPLSFSCPENFQVTGETSGGPETEMSLYASLIASLVDGSN